jgi:SAM-dependent methyltransferase
MSDRIGRVRRLRRFIVHQPSDPVATWTPRAGEPGLRSAMWHNEAYDRLADRDQWAGIERHLPAMRSSVLDLGCGTGRMTDRLAGLFDSYVGVDLAAMVEVAARRHVSLVTAGTAQGHDYPPEEHDLVLSMACLASACTAQELRTLAGSLASTLRPGGRLVLMDPFHTMPLLTRTCRARAVDVVAWFTAEGLRLVAHEGLHFVPVRLAVAGTGLGERATGRAYRLGEWLRARGAPLRSADYHVLCFERPGESAHAPDRV